ncbi:radical SAM protein [Patescibacteria group bacterium]|nr:radical SAM protein [Patescibacteria group bacterium]
MPKILRGEMVGPMMLEIHPTNAMCVYRCQMCIWCGGQKQTTSIADFYGAERLLTTDQWCGILEEVKGLGTHQIIFSGGGETLFSQAKVKPVLDKANSIGLETMIYTNGRTLYDADPALLDSILSSTWLRVSLHAATPEIYSRLINRPLGANDLGSVLDGIRKIVSLNKQRRGKLKVGIGIVLQELNYAEVAKIAKLCSDLEVDFLDVRVDCIGVTKKLSEYQYEQMLEGLRELRTSVEAGQSGFSASFADDLLIAMDQWKGMELTQPKRCLIPVVRPAIDPFGIVGACDSIGEPYTRSKSPREYVLGQMSNGCSFVDIMRSAAGKELGIRCKFCMPGQISLNALLEKLVDDFRIGIEPTSQPFCFDAS